MMNLDRSMIRRFSSPFSSWRRFHRRLLRNCSHYRQRKDRNHSVLQDRDNLFYRNIQYIPKGMKCYFGSYAMSYQFPINSSIYLKSVSSSAMTIHSTFFSVEFFAISSNTSRKILKLFSQCPRSVFSTFVAIVGIAPSRTSLKILKWIVNCAQVRRIIGKRSLWYFSQVFTANKTLSRLMGLP